MTFIARGEERGGTSCRALSATYPPAVSQGKLVESSRKTDDDVTLPQTFVDLVIPTLARHWMLACTDYLSIEPFDGGEDVGQFPQLCEAFADACSLVLGRAIATALSALGQKLGPQKLIGEGLWRVSGEGRDLPSVPPS